MFYVITCSTQILTLSIAPFWFISVGVLCEFAMAPNVCILLFPQKEKTGWTELRMYTCTDLAVH